MSLSTPISTTDALYSSRLANIVQLVVIVQN